MLTWKVLTGGVREKLRELAQKRIGAAAPLFAEASA
jgi:hypothetical protein